MFGAFLLQVPNPHGIRLEAENAILDGPHVAHERKGYSGSGYVTGLTKDGAKITWRFQATPGIYELRIGYAAAGPKGFSVLVDGFGASGMLPATGDVFGVRDAGRVELRSGENEVDVEKAWGYYDVDYVDLIPAGSPSAVRALSPKLCDSEATPEARTLFANLLRIYGAKTYTGQYQQDECDFVRRQTGRTPAILGGDLIDYSPSRLGRRKTADDVPGWIRAVNGGQILTLSWHWNAPTGLIDEKRHRMPDGHIEDASWEKGFYAYATTFDLAKALEDPTGSDYKLLLRDLDAIASQLKRLQNAHVPVLWRPLHEAEGGWFWWGAKGSRPCLQLYRLMFDRFTKVHGLHNLIWVWNSASPEWNPGDDVYDIITVDEYPDERRDALSAQWDDVLSRFNGRKPIALAEFPGAPDIERMHRFGVKWLYFVSWLGSVGPKSTDPQVLRSTYRSKWTLSLPASLHKKQTSSK